VRDFKSFQKKKNNNVVVFSFPFYIFILLPNWWFIRLQGEFPILRTRSCPDLYQPISPSRRLLALAGGGILIPEFIRLSPTLAVYDVGYSLPLGGEDRDFPLNEFETRKIPHTNIMFKTLYNQFLT
jgi:hypothetical protein